MDVLADLRALDAVQRRTVAATFLGWMLDAFDYFTLVMVIPAVAAGFGASIPQVAMALLLTLLCRPIGAWVFGRLADRHGRQRILMFDIALYSLLGLACAFAPSLAVLLALRALFGIAMGGEWGIGASLAMESIPVRSRGIVSGILQSGYPCGYLLAALAYGVAFVTIGWRGLFALGVVPALLVLYLRTRVPESPVFESRRRAGVRRGFRVAMRGHWGTFLYLLLLMSVYNALGHASTDLYPTFLKLQLHLDPHLVSLLAIVLNLGGLVGGLVIAQLSERIGRRRAMILAVLLALPAIPLWSYGGSLALLALGAFWLQGAVHGAWGVVPGYLNELAGDDVRATVPGFLYQCGNLMAGWTVYAMAALAHAHGGDYAVAQSGWIAVVAVVVVVVTWFAPEAHGVRFGRDDAAGGSGGGLRR